MTKRFSAILLAVIMAFSLLPVTASAENVKIDITVYEPEYHDYSDIAPPWPTYTITGNDGETEISVNTYRSEDGVNFYRISRTSEILCGRYYKVDFTISPKDPGNIMFDKSTDVNFFGVDNALDYDWSIENNKLHGTADFYYEHQTVHVQFDMNGHGSQVPDQYIDAFFEKVKEPEIKFDGDMMIEGWYGTAGLFDFSRWDFETMDVYRHTWLYAKWVKACKVTYKSIYGTKVVYYPAGHYISENGYNEVYNEYENNKEYVFKGVYTDSDYKNFYHSITTLTGDLTLYVKYAEPASEIDLRLNEPAEGHVQDPNASIISSNPDKMSIYQNGKWFYRLSEGQPYTQMKDGEEFTGGKYYKYDHITFDYPEKDRWEFEESLFNLKVNGKNKEFIADFYYPGSYFILSLEYVVPATVEFDMNGFGVQVPSQSVMPSECAEEPETPSCTGYRFSGWYTTPELDEKFDFSTPLNDSITLYAGWSYPVENADVYFDLPWLHCKAGESVKEIKASFDAPVDSTPIFWEKSNDGVNWESMEAGEEFFANNYYRAKMTLKNGRDYFFAPSVKATVCDSPDGVEYVLNADESLSVIYTKYLERTDHTVSYNMNGHGTQVPDEILEEGLTAARPEDPDEEGYAFGGWYTDSECKTPFDFNTQIVFDTTLYAKWRKVIHSVKITVPALFAGKTPPDKVTLSTEYGSEGLGINNCNIEWEKEYTTLFDYWHWFKKFEAGETYIISRVAIPADAADYLFADDLEITSNTGTVELLQQDERYAAVRIKVTVKSSGMFRPGEFDIAFNMMEHGEQIGNITVEAGSKVQKPADPSEDGWIFGGWYVDAKLTEKFDFDGAITEDTLVYAKWTKNSQAPVNPVNPDKPITPKTGDNTMIWLWVALLLISGGALASMAEVCFKRKSKTK